MTDIGSFQHHVEPGTQDDPGYALILLHGTGANEKDLVPLGGQVAPGKPLLSPLGKVREQGRPRWFRRKRPGVFDEEDLRARAKELASFLQEAQSEHGLPDQLVALGFSNGANIAAALLLLHPTVFRGAVLLRPMTPLEPDALPDLEGIPVLIAAGRHDELVPADSVENLASLLQEAGADTTLRWEEAGHGLAREEVAQVKRWLEANEDRLTQARGQRGSGRGST